MKHKPSNAVSDTPGKKHEAEEKIEATHTMPGHELHKVIYHRSKLPAATSALTDY